MNLKKRSLISMLTIFFIALPILAAPQQNQQGDCDNDTAGQAECRQDQACQADGLCTGTPNQQGHQSAQGRPGRGRHGQGQGQGQGMCAGDNQAIFPLTEIELSLLMAMREEEKLARDIYLFLDAEYLSPGFQSIARSEQRHMDALKRVITLQGLDDPIIDPEAGVFPSDGFTALYKTLTEQGANDYIAALKVGAYIEEIDIQDLQKALAVVTNPQLTRVFGNLLRGSYIHLRAFTAALMTEGVSYAPQVLTPEAYDAIINPPSIGSQGTGYGAGRGR